MTKTKLIEAVADKTRKYDKGTADIINATFEVIRDELAAGGEVNLIGFGKFSVKHKAARTARVPLTGEAVQVPAHKYPHFTPGKTFKDVVNRDN